MSELPHNPAPIPSPHRPVRGPAVRVTLGLCGVAAAVGTALVAVSAGDRSGELDGTLRTVRGAVRSPAAGRLVRWLAEPGDPVRPDTAVAEVEDAGRAARLAVLDAELDGLRADLAAAEHTAELELAWRTREVRAELHALRTDTAELLRRRFDLDLRHPAGDPVNGGYAPGDSVAVRTISAKTTSKSAAAAPGSAATAAELSALRNTREVLDARVELAGLREAELRELADSLPARVAAAAGVDGLRERLALAEARRADRAATPAVATVRAGRFATLGVPRVVPGERVGGRDTVLAPLHDGDRPFAEAVVPSGRLPEFAAGTGVSVRFPGERRAFDGRVVRVDPEAATPDGGVRVRIEHRGRLWPTRPTGTRVRVSLP